MAVKMIARCTKVGTLFIYTHELNEYFMKKEKFFQKKTSKLYYSSLTIADKSTDQTVKCYSPSRCICWNVQSHKQQRRNQKTHQPKLESGYMKKLDKYVKSLAKPMSVRSWSNEYCGSWNECAEKIKIGQKSNFAWQWKCEWKSVQYEEKKGTHKSKN